MSTTYIVRFRSAPSDGYPLLKEGQRRGRWCLLEVKDSDGAMASHNVVRVVDRSPHGIDGTTRRSPYHIGHYRVYFEQRATIHNAQRA